MYLNYYQSEINDEIDNPPIGMILCTDKDNVAAEYALGVYQIRYLLLNINFIFQIRKD